MLLQRNPEPSTFNWRVAVRHGSAGHALIDGMKIMSSKKFVMGPGALVLLSLVLTGAANAAVVSFSPFNAVTPDLDLTVDITVDGSSAFFDFSNNSTGSAAGSSLARIYFESGLAAVGLSNGAVVSGTGTDFGTSYPGPSSPPSGTNISWDGELAAFGASSPPSSNGLNVGDSVLISFDYTGSLAALLDAVTDKTGNARISGHVLDCVGGNSCAAVTVIPIPAALPLFAGALASIGFWRRRQSA